MEGIISGDIMNEEIKAWTDVLLNLKHSIWGIPSYKKRVLTEWLDIIRKTDPDVSTETLVEELGQWNETEET